MILETEGVEPRCEKRLGGGGVHGRHAPVREIFEFLGLGNAILEVVWSSFKRITEVRLLFNYHYINNSAWKQEKSIFRDYQVSF